MKTKNLRLGELAAALQMRNATPVTVDGKTYAPGDLWFSSCQWEKHLDADGMYYLLDAECVPSSTVGTVAMREAYPLVVWPDWVEFTIERVDGP